MDHFEIVSEYKPTLFIANNKTLAGQLYGEFKEFFPNNAVEYFVSCYEVILFTFNISYGLRFEKIEEPEKF